MPRAGTPEEAVELRAQRQSRSSGRSGRSGRRRPCATALRLVDRTSTPARSSRRRVSDCRSSASATRGASASTFTPMHSTRRPAPRRSSTPRCLEQLDEPHRHQRHEDDREVVRERRDERHAGASPRRGRASAAGRTRCTSTSGAPRVAPRRRHRWSRSRARGSSVRSSSQSMSPPSAVAGASRRAITSTPAAVKSRSIASTSTCRSSLPGRSRTAPWLVTAAGTWT